MKKKITITPVRVADLLAEGERMPVYVHVIDHPDARVLVDTGMTELHPAVADMDPRLLPLNKQDFDLAGIDIVVNTHLHFDHCGGNHLFAGKPIYVQRRELDDARSKDDYTIREWVDAPGVQYVPVDGEFELLPGLRLVPAPGHTDGMQMVVVETGGRPIIVGGDVAVWFGELDEPHTEGQLRVLALDPELVWLTHVDEPWRPREGQMRKVTFAINITIDGYCGHELGIADDELHEYFTGLLRDSDVEIFGRNTYHLMYPYWHDVAVNQSETEVINEFARTFDSIPKIVFSTTLKSVEWNNTTLLHSNLREEIMKLKQQPGKNISIGSLNIASQVARWDLIDEYHLVVHPVIAGKGPRLFESVENLTLKLVGSKTFRSGVVALHYKK